MAHYGNHQLGDELRRTDEYGNPIHNTGGAYGGEHHHGAPVSVPPTTQAPHHRRSGSSSSSSIRYFLEVYCLDLLAETWVELVGCDLLQAEMRCCTKLSERYGLSLL
ncbi:hypothetical protein F511_28334 [Dorcoceras hygrometricum]|uniref:Uncharacterized protein n=1 Tax=Dorcoceras hygrometricum TaxID=472368 RepID=A0A2Z7B0Q5_9LAMI|nr:hypothetical protein F511_28334 [Dorcoceras hygrometricum]